MNQHMKHLEGKADIKRQNTGKALEKNVHASRVKGIFKFGNSQFASHCVFIQIRVEKLRQA